MSTRSRLRNPTATGSKPFPDRLFFLNGNQRTQIRQALFQLGGAAGIPREGTSSPGARPPGQSTLERLAGMFLRSGNRVTLSELFQLNPDQLTVVARLLDALALGPVAVEWWLDDYAPKRMFRRNRSHRSSRKASG